MVGYIKITPGEPPEKLPENSRAYFFDIAMQCAIGREERCSLIYNLALCLDFSSQDWRRVMEMVTQTGEYEGSSVESLRYPLADQEGSE